MSNINVMRKNLGPVTAYKYAVQQGYTGTEQEFAALMASYATVAQEAESAKDDAVDAKTAAEAAQAAAEAAAEQAEGAIEVDDTLSVKGRAADAKETGEIRSSLNEFVSGVSAKIFTPLDNSDITWELGLISTDTGSNVSSSSRIRTKSPAFVCDIGSYIEATDAECIVFEYDADSGEYAGYKHVLRGNKYIVYKKIKLRIYITDANGDLSKADDITIVRYTDGEDISQDNAQRIDSILNVLHDNYAMQFKKYDGIVWEQGYIREDTGVKATSSSNIRTHQLISVKPFSKIIATANSFKVYFYNPVTNAYEGFSRVELGKTYWFFEETKIRIQLPTGSIEEANSIQTVLLYGDGLTIENREILKESNIPIIIYKTYYEPGNLSSGEKTENNSTTIRRTKDFIKSKDVDIIVLNREINAYRIYVSYYDENMDYVYSSGQINESVFFLDRNEPFFKFTVRIGSGSVSLTDSMMKDIKLYKGGQLIQTNKNNKDKLISFGYRRNGANHYQKTNLRFLFVSDLHGERNRTIQTIRFANDIGADYIDAVFNGGDTVYSVASDPLDWYEKAVSTCIVPVLNTVGNHDARDGQTISATTVYTNIIKPVQERTSISQPENAEINGYNYYYKDFDSIRVIVLDFIYWDSIQKTWLDGVLSDAVTNDLAVICMVHAPFASNECNYVDSSHWNYSDANRRDSNISDIEMVEAVNAFIENGGEFITWLCGHCHNDQWFTLPSYNNQFCLIVDSPYYVSNFTPKSDDPMGYNYNTIDYISVDRTNKLLKVLKIGANTLFSGKSRKTLVWDYQNKQILVDE